MKLKIDRILESWQDEAIALKVVGDRVYALVESKDGYDILKSITTNSYSGRYCFKTLEDAQAYWKDYNGSQHPTAVDKCIVRMA